MAKRLTATEKRNRRAKRIRKKNARHFAKKIRSQRITLSAENSYRLRGLVSAGNRKTRKQIDRMLKKIVGES